MLCEISTYFTLQISNEGTLGMRRNLVQYHFTSWPDFGVPKSPSGMLKFLRKIKHGSPIGFGAIVVHCRYLIICENNVVYKLRLLL